MRVGTATAIKVISTCRPIPSHPFRLTMDEGKRKSGKTDLAESVWDLEQLPAYYKWDARKRSGGIQ